MTLGTRFDVSAGARFDHESRTRPRDVLRARRSRRRPRSTPTRASRTSRRRSRWRTGSGRTQTLYATVGRGYKAGGFNPASPAGSEAYGEEQTWNIEGGVKTLWAGGRVSANAAVFHIDWDDLQLNVPDPAVPAQFFIANVGGATSNGVELEIAARAAPGSTCSPPSAPRRPASAPAACRGRLGSRAMRCPSRRIHTRGIGARVHASLVGTAVRPRPRRPGAVGRRSRTTRGQLARPGRLHARAPPRRLHGAALASREVFVRNALTEAPPTSRSRSRIRLAGVGLPGRDGRAADPRGERRRPLLKAGNARACRGGRIDVAGATVRRRPAGLVTALRRSRRTGSCSSPGRATRPAAARA